MITIADFTRLQEELSTTKTELEQLRLIDVDGMKTKHGTEINDLKAEIDLLKTDESVMSTDVYKSIHTELESSKQTISDLEKSVTDLKVDKEDIDRVVNLRVMEKLASVGLPPLKDVSTETKQWEGYTIRPL